MDRIDKPNAALLVFAIVVLGVLVWKGPVQHQTVAATALFGLIGMVTTALRGRLVKRDPTAFKDGES